MAGFEFRAFDTICGVWAQGCSAQAFDDVRDMCVKYERMFSPSDPSSEINRVNRLKGASLAHASEEFCAVVERSLSYCAQTDGLLDITMGGLVELWDWRRAIVPTQGNVEDALRHVNYRGLRVVDGVLEFDDAQTQVTFGGVAKGYIADALMDRLREWGARHAMVNLGGNVMVMGGKSDVERYRVGVRAPVAAREAVVGDIAVVELSDGTAVTSGVYERAFTRNGVRYHHILDPRTGYPAQTDIVSATVVCKSSFEGDALATALVIMGYDRARAFVEDREGVEAVFVFGDGRVVPTAEGLLAQTV